jgi:hypothetical protein
MTSPVESRLSPALSDVCPAFREKMAEYQEAAKRDRIRADALFREAQQIAADFRKQAAR